jgi:VanZ family protein
MLENILPTLRFKELWLIIGWSLILLVIGLSLMSSPPLLPSFDGIDKLEHFLAYFVLMGWFSQLYHAPQQRLTYLIGFILLGGVLEILQNLGGVRQGEWADMIANSTGVLFAWQLTKSRLAHALVFVEYKLTAVTH